MISLDARAQAELSNALTHDDLPGTAAPSVSSDPMERARAKIAALQGQSAAQQELKPASDAGPTSPAPGLATDPVQTAYKILGLPPGSGYLDVGSRVDELRSTVRPGALPCRVGGAV